MNETARDLIERIIDTKRAYDAYLIRGEVFKRLNEGKLERQEAELLYKLADDKEQMLSRHEHALHQMENIIHHITNF